MDKMKVVKIDKHREEDVRWGIDRASERLDEYEEFVVIGKKKGTNGWTKFHGRLKDPFWWAGVLTSVIRSLLEDGTYTTEEGEGYDS